MTDQVAPSGAGTAAIEVTGVTVRYGALVAVDSVDLTVRSGEVLGLIGPNGAGKTSLLECVEGLRRPAAGRIRVAGVDPAADRTAMARISGVQLQDSAYPSRAKVGEVCALFASFYRDPADVAELLEQFDLAAQRGSTVTRLSGGQRQRLSLVLALIGRPRIVFLDELTTGLDPQARRLVWAGLRARNDDGLTVVLTSHHMDEIEYLCDRVAVMTGGAIVAIDTVAALIKAHAPEAGRIVVEDHAAHDGLRAELDGLGDGVRVTPAGGRLQVDLADPAAAERIGAVLDRYGADSRRTGASLEDVYLTLTGSTVDGR